MLYSWMIIVLFVGVVTLVVVYTMTYQRPRTNYKAEVAYSAVSAVPDSLALGTDILLYNQTDGVDGLYVYSADQLKLTISADQFADVTNIFVTSTDTLFVYTRGTSPPFSQLVTGGGGGGGDESQVVWNGTTYLTPTTAANGVLTNTDETLTWETLPLPQLLPKQVVEVTSTNNSFTVPSDVTMVALEVVGGGGGGGGQGNANDAAGGGGAAGFARVFLTREQVSDLTTLDITIGTGGAGGTGTNDGDDGVDSVIRYNPGNLLMCTAAGGGGGGHGNNLGIGGLGGAGSVEVAFIGVGQIGGAGEMGRDSGTSVTNVPGANGGDSALGPGGRGAYDAPDGDSTAGLVGGGGGGGANSDNHTHPGSAGGAGKCILYYY